jgi:hypothetical protein
VKKYFTKKFAVIASIVALLFAGAVYSQTSIHEIEGFLQFRSQDPQMRYAGRARMRNLAGTASAPMSFNRPLIRTAATTLTLTAADCGAVILSVHTTATQTFTLPTAADVPGCEFTFTAGHAGTEILIDAAADAQGFVFTNFAAVGADADTAIVTEADGAPGIKNTAATNAIGDSLTLMSDGVLTWHGVGIASGIWAAQ